MSEIMITTINNYKKCLFSVSPLLVMKIYGNISTSVLVQVDERAQFLPEKLVYGDT
jgi:hypothetical protein